MKPRSRSRKGARPSPSAASAAIRQVEASRPIWMTRMVYTVLAVAGLLLLWALGLIVEAASVAGRLSAEGWGEYGGVIVRNRIWALGHGAFMLLIAAGFLHLLSVGRSRWENRRLRLARWGLVLLVAADALILSRHYIQTMPASTLEENEVVRRLKADRPQKRVALVTQEGFYNNWLTYVFPYHGIKSVNITQMPRMPEEYQRFLEAVGRKPLRLWQLAAVGYVLAPAPVWAQIQADPVMRDAFKPVFAYNVVPRDGDVAVVPATTSAPGQLASAEPGHVILSFERSAPYFAPIGGWEAVDDEEALRRLSDESRPLFSKLLVAPEHAGDLPASEGGSATGMFALEEYRPGYLRLKVSVDRPAILRVAEKYEPDWRARVDSRPAKVRRVDYLFMGVYLEAGLHEVELVYREDRLTLGVLALGAILCAGAGTGFLRRKGREPCNPAAPEAPKSTSGGFCTGRGGPPCLSP